MRSGLGLVGLLVVLAIVALVAKKQLAGTPQVLPAAAVQGAPADGDASTVRGQGRRIEQQIGQQVQTLTQPREMPDDAQ